MSTDTTARRLATSPTPAAEYRFGGRREQRAFARLATVIDVPVGHTLTRQGEIGHEFVVVIDGVASVFVDGLRVATLGTGEHFGEMSLIDNGPRTATVVAETPMRLAVVARANFPALLTQAPTLMHSVLAAMARRLRGAA